MVIDISHVDLCQELCIMQSMQRNGAGARRVGVSLNYRMREQGEQEVQARPARLILFRLIFSI